MKKSIIVGSLLLAGVFVLFCCGKTEKTPEQLIEQKLIVQADSFSAGIRHMQVILKTGSATEKQLQRSFLQTRMAFKKMEWAVEYYAPTITRFVNGPPVPEVEPASQQVFEPDGLQIIESLIFPKYDSTRIRELAKRLQQLSLNADSYKVYFNNVELYNWQIFDAAKLEVFRILTLGITGFDTPLSQNSMVESAGSLMSLQEVMAHYTATGNTFSLLENLNAASRYLTQNTDFDTFNRALFITEYGNKITISLTRLQQHLPIPVVKYNRLLNQKAETLFDKNAFNVNAFSPGIEYAMTDKRIALGKKLFSDPILSGTFSRSCASCHQPDKAFTDGMAKNTTINGTDLVSRNTPTLLNAALQPAQFYDLRANILEEQVQDVIQSKAEMHGNVKISTDKLWKNKVYQMLFSNAYPQADRESIDTLEVTNAISSYIRSLTSLNSRFDDYMRGNKMAMNESEVRGFNLFMGKAKCATCHYMPLFNGTVPPKYIKIETEVIGVPLSTDNKAIDPDPGRFAIVPIASYKHAFKTTTIRNAAQTAPYMHNGLFTTLNEVVDFYNNGGGAGIGLKIDNQTLAPDKLNLSEKEKVDLIAFIKSLDNN